MAAMSPRRADLPASPHLLSPNRGDLESVTSKSAEGSLPRRRAELQEGFSFPGDEQSCRRASPHLLSPNRGRLGFPLFSAPASCFCCWLQLSEAAADAKFYGHVEVFNLLKARGAIVPKTRKTPMAVSNPQEVPEYEINPAELQLRKGEGIAKGVYQEAKWNGTKVAIKVLDKESYSNLESINAFKHELTLLEKVRHPNLVQFVGAVTQNMPMMIVSEYHTRGDLQSYLQKRGRLKPHKALRLALDIARGMNYLHECKPDPIIHLDLRPKNILFDSGNQLKVAGFGLIQITKVSPDKAKLAQPEARIHRSSLCMAPEVYKDEIFDRSADVFSFGLILYEMIEGAPAFHPKTCEDASTMICLEGLRPPFRSKSKSYPPDVKELIEECWDPDPTVRPTFSEIIIRLDKTYAKTIRQGRWKDNFRLPWK